MIQAGGDGLELSESRGGLWPRDLVYTVFRSVWPEERGLEDKVTNKKEETGKM